MTPLFLNRAERRSSSGPSISIDGIFVALRSYARFRQKQCQSYSYIFWMLFSLIPALAYSFRSFAHSRSNFAFSAAQLNPIRIPPFFWNFEKTKISKAEGREAGKKRPMAQFCYQKQTCAIGRCKKIRSKPSCLEKIAASCCSPFCFTIWLAAYLSCQEIESVNCKYIVTGSLPTYFSFIPLLFLNSASTIAIRWRYQESPQIRTPRFVMFVWSSVSPMHDSLGIRISVEEKCSAIFASSGNRLLQRAEKVQRVNAPWTNRDSAPSLYTVSS